MLILKNWKRHKKIGKIVKVRLLLRSILKRGFNQLKWRGKLWREQLNIKRKQWTNGLKYNVKPITIKNAKIRNLKWIFFHSENINGKWAGKIILWTDKVNKTRILVTKSLAKLRFWNFEPAKPWISTKRKK